MINPTPIRPIRILAGGAIAALLFLVALFPSAGQATGKTETLRVFSQQQSFTYTAADGTVTKGPPAGQSQPGDSFEIDSLDFRGTHRKHAKRAFGSDYLHCVFTASGEPDCMGYTALRGSLLRFHGMDVIGAVGRYKGGKVLSSKEVKGGSDFVVRLELR